MLPSMTTTQEYDVSIAPVNAQGKPATVDGDPTWASSDESVAKVIPIPGTLTATVRAQGVGHYSISVTADADLGPGVRQLAASDEGDVTLAEAASLGTISAGAVREQA